MKKLLVLLGAAGAATGVFFAVKAKKANEQEVHEAQEESTEKDV